MKPTRFFLSSTLLAGLMAAGGAMAQNPNPVPSADGMPASRDAVRAEARVNNHSPANTVTPGGEASTRINSQPNVMPTPISATTRAEVRQETLKVKPRFGERGERPEVPTNPTSSTGTPK